MRPLDSQPQPSVRERLDVHGDSACVSGCGSYVAGTRHGHEPCDAGSPRLVVATGLSPDDRARLPDRASAVRTSDLVSRLRLRRVLARSRGSGFHPATRTPTSRSPLPGAAHGGPEPRGGKPAARAREPLLRSRAGRDTRRERPLHSGSLGRGCQVLAGHCQADGSARRTNNSST